MNRFARPVLGALVVGAALLASCSTNRSPRFDMKSGSPEQFVRYTGRPAVDYIFRWDSRAFTKVQNHLDDVMSPDKVSTLKRNGQPEYVRLGVASDANETFDEWAYWDRNTICQFIQGELVYEGPLLDSDRWLIQHGYPTEAYRQQYEVGPYREIWTYSGMYEMGDEVVSFSDGKEVYRSQF